MSENCSINKSSCNSISKDSPIDLEKHWSNAYTGVNIETLGWYEKESLPTLELILASEVSKKATILNIGAGASTIIDSLVEKGFTSLIVNDISSCAMSNIKARLGEKADKIQFITDDIVNPKQLQDIEKVDLWNDRAVLHFFTEEKDQKAYFDLLNTKVKKGGFVILAEFNKQGAKSCSGLNVKQYNAESLQTFLGSEYSLLKSFNYDYEMPSKKIRKYVYTLFQREG